jgi:hypothetical protein
MPSLSYNTYAGSAFVFASFCSLVGLVWVLDEDLPLNTRCRSSWAQTFSWNIIVNKWQGLPAVTFSSIYIKIGMWGFPSHDCVLCNHCLFLSSSLPLPLLVLVYPFSISKFARQLLLLLWKQHWPGRASRLGQPDPANPVVSDPLEPE